MCHLLGVAVALRGVLGGGAGDNRGHSRGHLRCELPHRRDVVADVGQGNGQRGVALERHRTGEQLVEQHAGGVHVRGRGRGLARGLLGGEVLGGAEHHPRAGERGVSGPVGDAEVGDLDLPVWADQDVARLDVAVHDAGRVRDRQRFADLADDVHRGLGVQPPLFAQHLPQVPALDELHHDEVQIAVLTGVEDLRDVRVTQGGGGTCLTDEPGHERRVVGVLLLEELDRHPPIESFVDRLVDRAHAAGGDAANQPITTRQCSQGPHPIRSRMPHRVEQRAGTPPAP